MLEMLHSNYAFRSYINACVCEIYGGYIVWGATAALGVIFRLIILQNNLKLKWSYINEGWIL